MKTFLFFRKRFQVFGFCFKPVIVGRKFTFYASNFIVNEGFIASENICNGIKNGLTKKLFLLDWVLVF